jgi:formylglycine-generating enzyme required for sulfatase activity
MPNHATTLLNFAALLGLAAATWLPAAMADPAKDRSPSDRAADATETEKPAAAASAKDSAGFEGRRAGQQRSDNEMNMKFIWCPPGKFTMGSPKSETHRRDNEEQAEVTLTAGFWLAKTELRQVEWLWIMETRPWKGKEGVKDDNDHPASCISWDDVLAFCRKFTTQERKAGRLPEGYRYTLPTEAQWEYACRAGSTTAFSFGDDESLMGDYAWWGGTIGDGNAAKEPYAHRVGAKKANPWGLCDMHGNLAEWCRDGYQEKASGGADPEGFSDEPLRTIRGGNWADWARWCRSATRLRLKRDNADCHMGLRLAICPVRE